MIFCFFMRQLPSSIAKNSTKYMKEFEIIDNKQNLWYNLYSIGVEQKMMKSEGFAL